ncbi:WD repeat protein [Aspergillus luchuensis]|uniref:WD repeat protein n=1 Tax=Aspergillus kawachii TaxID=1069201 RepID=A0A146FNY9_ASPKA|nr:WD repeat protein [Aspergillus luchuensis]
MSRIHTPEQSEELAVIEEAQFLLSQFIRNSSHQTRGSPASSRGDQNTAPGECSRTGEDIRGSVKKRGRPPKTPKTRVEPRSSPAITGENRITSSTPQTPDPLYFSEQDRPDTASSPGDGREMSSNRRSRRARSGPNNYYDKTNYLGFGSDEDVSESPARPSPTTSRRPRFSSIAPQPNTSSCVRDRDGQARVIYSSPHVQIIKSPFRSLDDLRLSGRACYLSLRSPGEYALKYQNRPPLVDEILHIDFDRTEMAAIMDLFCFCGFQRHEEMDTALSDQLIQAAHDCDISQRASKKIRWVCELSQIISTEEIVGIDASHKWLSEAMAPNSKNKRKRQARSLVGKILGLVQDTSQDSPLLFSGNQLWELSRVLPSALVLSRRGPTEIDAFIADAKRGCLPSNPCVIEATASGSRCAEISGSLNKILQRRELGLRVKRQLQSNTNKGFKLAKTWKDASNDVIVLAWAPDGTKFAAGATAQCDEHNMEYNRNNNLVVGDIVNNELMELPDHYVLRPPGRSAASRTLHDPRLWMSVTSIEWWEDALFTASYDNTVKIWNASGRDISCRKTLQHDSKVEVMARSHYERNLLATGTRSIGLWSLAESTHTLLELPRARSRKDRELVPTSLAWGTIKETGNILLAGMCEKGDGTLQTGLLAGWRIGEASISPMQFSPNSQNMFDIKWHPTLPIFAAATSIGHGPVNKAYKDTRSLVRMYQPLSSKVCTMEFECPALDINDAYICPMNPSYVTASCTDGITYVWDHRRPDRILHKLQHGEPLNQIDETISREQADVGVRLSLWGDRIDEFYTGSSDGVLKRWDILRAPEDVLVHDTARFDEEIMCGAFSEDKSNLLVGDAAGGVHLLSPGPFTSNEGLSMKFKPSLQPQLQMCPDGHVSNPESGIKAGAELLESGKLSRHPTYGVGQGPFYDGPFAAWARPENTPEHEIAQTRLKEEVQLRQLDGPPPDCRIGLDTATQQDVKAQIKLAHIRNRRRNQNKRTLDGLTEPLAYAGTDAVDPVSDVPDNYKRRLHHVVSPTVSMPPNIGLIDPVRNAEWRSGSNVIHFAEVQTALQEVEEALEEDFWWPPSSAIDANIRDVDGI